MWGTLEGRRWLDSPAEDHCLCGEVWRMRGRCAGGGAQPCRPSKEHSGEGVMGEEVWERFPAPGQPEQRWETGLQSWC